MNNIRNFSIIAHIDHGKSTLSDRLIQICGGLSNNDLKNQILDSMDLERERGITIKAQNVTLTYKSYDKKTYQLNFIDTPGHVDFSYEVSRSLSACEGALLIVDSGQGVEAQTIAHCYTAIEMNLTVVPILNKVDLITSSPQRVAKEIEDIIGINAFNAVRCSAKTGIGIIDVLERIIKEIPSPTGDPKAPLQALIIDSWFDNYLGIISLVRIKNGTLNKGDKIKVMSSGQIYNADQLGIFIPKRINCEILNCGEVGWLSCGMKDIYGAPVGDTLTTATKPAIKSLSGFKKIKPQVYAGLFPINSENYEVFRNALGKLSLNDTSLVYEPENSSALGFGFRCGFLGLLHMEIIQERLNREYNLNIITTAPTVTYEIVMKDKKILYIDSPSLFPSLNKIYEIREPIAECYILLPKKYLGSIMSLCISKRGVQKNIVYYNNHIALTYNIPMSEIVLDFFDQIKSMSCGYASLTYNFKYFKKSDVLLIDILINGCAVKSLSFITHRCQANNIGRKFIDKLKKLIPRHQFDIIIQVVIGNNIIARASIKQLRKNVIEKCYGGDISRKKKLLKKQKDGKKKMKQVGKVQIPQEAFLAILHINKYKK